MRPIYTIEAHVGGVDALASQVPTFSSPKNLSNRFVPYWKTRHVCRTVGNVNCSMSKNRENKSWQGGMFVTPDI